MMSFFAFENISYAGPLRGNPLDIGGFSLHMALQWASYAVFKWFRCFSHKQCFYKTFKLSVIWDATTLTCCHSEETHLILSIWILAYPEQALSTGTSYCIPRILRDTITWLYSRYTLLVHRSLHTYAIIRVSMRQSMHIETSPLWKRIRQTRLLAICRYVRRAPAGCK